MGLFHMMRLSNTYYVLLQKTQNTLQRLSRDLNYFQNALASFGSVIDSDANTSGVHFPLHKFAGSQGSHLVCFRQVPIGSEMSVSNVYVQLGYFIYTASDGLRQWDYWRRREGDISNNDICTTFVKRFYGAGAPQLWAKEAYTAFMLLREAQTYPEMNWAPVIQ